MNILHVIQRYPPAIGGAEQWCQHLCHYAAAQGHRVTVLALDVYHEDEFWTDPPPDNCLFRFGGMEYDRGVRVIRCRRTKVPGILYRFFWMMEKLFTVYLYGPHSLQLYWRLVVHARRADVIHLHTAPYPHNLWGLLWGRVFGKKVVFTPHFHIGNRQFQSPWVKWQLKWCDAVFAVTALERDFLISRGLDPAKVHIGYNTLDPAEYRMDPEDPLLEKCRRKYGLTGDTRTVIFIGRKAEYKGIQTLINAVRMLRPGLPVKLLMVGPDFPWFRTYYAGLTAAEREYIIDCGIVPHREKVALLHLADVLALPSRFEAFGIVFLEAWACAKPVIGPDNEIASEVLKGAGMSVPWADVPGLAAALQRLLADSVLCRELAAGGRRRLERRYALERVGRNVLAAYGGLPVRRVHINWFVTWQCNYACVYCWQKVGGKIYRSSRFSWQPAQRWARAFNLLQPFSIEISGGEPTLYPGLFDAIEQLDKRIRVTMTTNAGPTFAVQEFVKRFKPAGRGGSIGGLALSFHPQYADFDDFLSKARLLRSRGFCIQINFVMHPRQMWDVQRYRDVFQSSGLCMHIEPFVAASEKEGGEKMFLSPEEIAWTAKWTSPEASPANADRCGKQQFIPGSLDDSNASMKKEWGCDRRPVICPAGKTILAVEGNGDAYPCVSSLTRSKIFGRQAMPHYRSLGAVFDDDFACELDGLLCWESFRCCGCDYDAVKDQWIFPDIPQTQWPTVPE